jgi:aryl-alcohol dehydrogenase-like predicted oxidoreductase
VKNTALGRSGLQVSGIAFGTWQLGGDWGRFDEDTAVKAIRRAHELGVNFFVGARQAKHVEDSLAAADVSLSNADLAKIDKIMASATPVADPSPETV